LNRSFQLRVRRARISRDGGLSAAHRIDLTDLDDRGQRPRTRAGLFGVTAAAVHRPLRFCLFLSVHVRR
jgi:hypothetical protein